MPTSNRTRPNRRSIVIERGKHKGSLPEGAEKEREREKSILCTHRVNFVKREREKERVREKRNNSQDAVVI